MSHKGITISDKILAVLPELPETFNASTLIHKLKESRSGTEYGIYKLISSGMLEKTGYGEYRKTNKWFTHELKSSAAIMLESVWPLPPLKYREIGRRTIKEGIEHE